MEPRGFVAEWNATEEKLTVWGAAKVAFANRTILADAMALSENQIDMVEVDVGGGFGSRGEFYPEDFLIPFAARHLNRPVKWIEDRREHLLAANHARELECDVEIAATKDGKIIGLRGPVLGEYRRLCPHQRVHRTTQRGSGHVRRLRHRKHSADDNLDHHQ